MEIVEGIIDIEYFDHEQSRDVADELASFFSENYGIWKGGFGGGKNGERVKMTGEFLKKNCLFDENCFVVRAVEGLNGHTVGHTIYKRFDCKGENDGIWVTQLVVKKDKKDSCQMEIARMMLSAIMLDGDVQSVSCVGLVSSNPITIKALEKASGDYKRVPSDNSLVKEIVSKANIPYLTSHLNEYDEKRGTIDTKFYVDHGEMVKDWKGLGDDVDWKFGVLKDGEEFLALVFKDVFFTLETQATV